MIWLKIQKLEYLENETLEKFKKFLTCVSDYHFTSYHFLAEITFNTPVWSDRCGVVWCGVVWCGVVC